MQDYLPPFWFSSLATPFTLFLSYPLSLQYNDGDMHEPYVHMPQAQTCAAGHTSALPCPGLHHNVQSLIHKRAHAEIWAVPRYITYVTSVTMHVQPKKKHKNHSCVQAHHTTRHMKVWSETSSHPWDWRNKSHLIKPLLPQHLVNALFIHKKCLWDKSRLYNHYIWCEITVSKFRLS
jgi:hypothetical protein